MVKDEDGNGAFGVSGTDSLTPLIPALNEMCLYFHVSQVWGPDHPFDGRWQNVLLRRVSLSQRKCNPDSQYSAGAGVNPGSIRAEEWKRWYWPKTISFSTVSKGA